VSLHRRQHLIREESVLICAPHASSDPIFDRAEREGRCAQPPGGAFAPNREQAPSMQEPSEVKGHSAFVHTGPVPPP